MVECVMSWILLFVAVFKGDAAWFIASGVFAIATNIWRVVELLSSKGE